MPNSGELTKLYGALQSCANPGAAFEEFCAALLDSMGFTSIFCRRGTEQGRDIDAEFCGFRWFFECKLVREDVETAAFAYKFLQLDALDKKQRPDFFVLLSNGSIKSILKDIVRFKQADEHTTYEVDLWANHTSDNIFDDIVLSEIDTALSFLQNTRADALSFEESQRLRKAAKSHNGARGRFVERLSLSPLFRQREGSSVTNELVKLAHDTTVAAVWNSDVVSSMFSTLFVIGIPDRSAYGLLPCTSYHDREELARAYRPWAMTPSDSQQEGSILFDEHTGISRVSTLMTEWGSITTLSDLPFCDEIVQPNEFFIAIKEAAVRFRNYLKRGALITPCWLYVRVDNLTRAKIGRSMGLQSRQLRFRAADRGYLEPLVFEEFDDDYVLQLPVCAKPVRIMAPPSDYRELGLALAENIWSAVSGKQCNVLEVARSIHDRLQESWKNNKNTQAWNQLMEFRKGFDFILDSDLFPRPYSNFDPK